MEALLLSGQGGRATAAGRNASAAVRILALLLLLLPATLLAQHAELHGRVTDDERRAVPQASVSVANNETGYTRSVTTDAAGAFRFAALPAGMYEVTASKKGFTSITTQNVEANAGTEHRVDLAVRASEVAEEVTRTAENRLIEESPTPVTVIMAKALEALPWSPSPWSAIASLARQAWRENADPGELGLQVNGGTGRAVNFLADGGDNNDAEVGGPLVSIGTMAIQEAMLATLQERANYGPSSAGTIGIVTRTGTNDLRTSVHAVYGGDAAGERRQYAGAAIGGPVLMDRVHFFAALDRTAAVNRDTILRDFAGITARRPFARDGIMATTTADVSTRHFLLARLAYQENVRMSGATALDLPSAFERVFSQARSLVLTHTWQVGDEVVNALLAETAGLDETRTPQSNDPSIVYPSGVHSGSTALLLRRAERKHQLRDDLTLSRVVLSKRHDITIGGSVTDERLLAGRLQGSGQPEYTLLDDSPLAAVRQITISQGSVAFNTPVRESAFYVEDQFAPMQKLTLSVGLRHDQWNGFPRDQRSNPIWQALSQQTKYGDPALRPFREQGGQPLGRNGGWAPRIAFAYAVRGDSPTVISGGAGRYFSFPSTAASILFPAAALGSTYRTTYDLVRPEGIRNADGTLFRVGDPLPPSQIPLTDGGVPNDVASPTLSMQRTDRFSLSSAWALNAWLGVTTNLLHVSYRHLPYAQRGNPTDAATGKRRFPQFGDFRIWYGDGRARYDGFSIGGHLLVGKMLEARADYTLSSARGTILAGPDEPGIAAAEHQPDLRAVSDESADSPGACTRCSGPLDFDARHRVAVTAMIHAPFGIGVAAVFRYRSATPYTDWMGYDVNGDGSTFDLPPGVSHVNTLRGAAFSQADLRVSKQFDVPHETTLEIAAEILNVLGASNRAGYRGNRFVFTRSAGAMLVERAPNPLYRTPSSRAGDPGQGDARTAQVALRLTF
jgi:hypothetical protein